MKTSSPAPETLPCPRCGEQVVVVRVDRDRDWMRLNPTPDPSGEAILLTGGTRALLISHLELLAQLEDAERRIRANPETQARRYRNHAKTCRGFHLSEPTRSSGGAGKIARTDQLEKLKVLRRGFSDIARAS